MFFVDETHRVLKEQTTTSK